MTLVFLRSLIVLELVGCVLFARASCVVHAQDFTAVVRSGGERSSGVPSRHALREGPQREEAAMLESRKATLPASEIAGFSRSSAGAPAPSQERSGDRGTAIASAKTMATSADRSLGWHVTGLAAGRTSDQTQTRPKLTGDLASDRGRGRVQVVDVTGAREPHLFTSSAGHVPCAGAAAGGGGDRSGVDRSTLPGASPAIFSAEHRQRMQLALELAVVCVNEGAFEHLGECALVYQVVEARAQSTRDRRDFLRSHSPRALGLKPCSSGNCLWTPDLLTDPNESPAAFDPAWWEVARDHRWREVLRYARGLVFGIEQWRPCDRAPWSWGYAGDLTGAFKRGLRPLGCSGVDQDGFVLASKPAQLGAVLSAHQARGGKGRGVP